MKNKNCVYLRKNFNKNMNHFYFNKKINNQSGFTLIELLVVIAIIGILSGVVMASLSGARDKGADAGIISGVNSVRTMAIQYSNNKDGFSYDGFCAIDKVTEAKTAITKNSGTAPECSEGGDGVSYAFSAKLKSNPDWYYCVSSYNDKAGTTTGPAADGRCP